jgi:transcriptional regulator with XRE-family HTH domain
MKKMAKIICSYRAVGGNYNSPRDSMRMITGEEMKNARQKIGKTQEQLADEMDYSPRQLSRFENNENLERYDKFLQLVVTLELYRPVEKTKEEKTEVDE